MSTPLSRHNAALAELRHARLDLERWRDKTFPFGTKVYVKVKDDMGNIKHRKATVRGSLKEPTQVWVRFHGSKNQTKVHVKDLVKP